jgi:hypothetical protein
MKRSIQVSAPLLAATALALLTGCRKPQMQRCVDEQNRVVPDTYCQNPQQTRNATGGYVPMYRYYYGGSGGFGIGTPVTGGSYTAVSGASYATSTSRGGFGSSMGGGSSSSSGGDAAGSGS